MVATTGQSEQFSGTVPNSGLEPLPGFWQDLPAGIFTRTQSKGNQ
jgi:hypothetical protein